MNGPTKVLRFGAEARQASDTTDVRELIDHLGLAPHPEGGWYRETWRAEAGDGARASATTIFFLLEKGQSSHWHKLDAAEIWLWHAGYPVSLSTAPSVAGPITSITLGPDVLGHATPQHIIAKHHWQAADASAGWALVSCIVSPGFEFSGFTLAPDEWKPGI